MFINCTKTLIPLQTTTPIHHLFLLNSVRGYMRGLINSPSRQAQQMADKFSDTHPNILRSDPLLSQTTNLIMKDGKKVKAYNLLLSALNHLHTLVHLPDSTLSQNVPSHILYADAIARVAPLVELKAFKRGNKVLQIPKALDDRQRNRRAIQWIMQAANKRPEKQFSLRFANEILLVLNNSSEVNKRKAALYKLALANRINVNVKMNI